MRIRVATQGAGRRSSAQAPTVTPSSYSSPASMVVKSFEVLPFAAMPLGAGDRGLESKRAFILRTGMSIKRARHEPFHHALRPDTDEHTLPRIRHAVPRVQMFSGEWRCHRLNGAPCRDSPIFNLMPAGVVVYSATGELTHADATATELLRVTQHIASGALITDPRWQCLRKDGSVFPIEKYPVTGASSARTLERIIMLGLTHDGDELSVRLMGNAYPVINTAGDVSEIVVSCTDVTNLKQAERALRKLGKRLHLAWPRFKACAVALKRSVGVH